MEKNFVSKNISKELIAAAALFQIIGFLLLITFSLELIRSFHQHRGDLGFEIYLRYILLPTIYILPVINCLINLSGEKQSVKKYLITSAIIFLIYTLVSTVNLSSNPYRTLYYATVGLTALLIPCLTVLFFAKEQKLK